VRGVSNAQLQEGSEEKLLTDERRGIVTGETYVVLTSKSSGGRNASSTNRLCWSRRGLFCSKFFFHRRVTEAVELSWDGDGAGGVVRHGTGDPSRFLQPGRSQGKSQRPQGRE